MKYILIFLSITLMVNFFGCSSQKEEPAARPENQSVSEQNTAQYQYKKYDIKSGIVQFECSDPMGTHKEVLYFDDYGTKERLEKYDTKDAIKEIIFSDGKQSYSVNNAKKVAYITNKYSSNGTEMRFNKDEWDNENKAKYDYKDLPEMQLAGKNCQVFSINSGYGITTFAGWGYITLYHYQETSVGIVSRKAVSIEENVQIPTDKFMVPEGYEIKEAGAF